MARWNGTLSAALMLAACGIGAPQSSVLKLDKAWATAAPGTGFTGRFKKGFSGVGAVPLPADPSFALQQQPGYLASFERAIGNWSEPDGMIVPQEDCPGGKFRMGIEAWHASGIHHIDVYAEGGTITIPGSALGMLTRTDAVTGITWNNPNHYVFDLALPDSYNNASYGAAGTCGLVADIFPNAGWPLRIGQSSGHYQGYPAPSAFVPLTLVFDPYGYIYGDTTGARSQKLYVSTTGNDTTGAGTAAAPFATYSQAWTKISTTKPCQILFDDGIYAEATTNSNRFKPTLPVMPWLRAKNCGAVTMTGYAYGWATVSGQPNGVYHVNLNALLLDGITINLANMTAFGWTNATNVFLRRGKAIEDYGAYNGPPGSDYCTNGPRIDRIYGIYSPIGWGFAPNVNGTNSPPGTNHKLSRDFWVSANCGLAVMESIVTAYGNTAKFFSRNTVSKTASDSTRPISGIRVFGDTAYVQNPSVERYHKEECLKIGSIIGYDGTNTTIGIAPNPDGSQPTVYSSSGNSGNFWIIDPNSPYDVSKDAVYGGYNSAGGTVAVAAGATSVQFQGDWRSLPVGTPFYFGGYGHGDYLQFTSINPPTSAKVYTPSHGFVMDNVMLTHTTMTGRPSSNPWTMSNNLNIAATTPMLNGDGTYSTVTTTIAFNADGQSFTTMYNGSPLPVLWMGRGMLVSINKPTTEIGRSASILAYNNTTSPIVDPYFGTLQPGQGVLAYPVNGASNYSGRYLLSSCIQNVAFVNYLNNPGDAAGNASTCSMGGCMKNWLFLGSTVVYGGCPKDTPDDYGGTISGRATEGWSIIDSIMWQFNSAWPKVASLNSVYVSNAALDASSSQEAVTASLGTTWADRLKPATPTGFNRRAATGLRKFDRYGAPVVPGVSLVGAQAA